MTNLTPIASALNRIALCLEANEQRIRADERLRDRVARAIDTSDEREWGVPDSPHRKGVEHMASEVRAVLDLPEPGDD